MNRTRLREQLKKHEGVRLFPYTDTVGKLTIGVGRNLADRGISEHEADLLLDNDINVAWSEATRVVPGLAGLDEDRQHVILDMIFNLGAAGLLKFKKFLAAVERRDFAAAADEMLDSRWARQVGERAKRLAAMMRPKPS